MKRYKIFSPRFTSLVLIVCFAMLICSFDHDGPMLSAVGHPDASGHSNTTGHANATVWGCSGEVCLTLVPKAAVSPDMVLGLFLFVTLLLSSRFVMDTRFSAQLSVPLQWFSYHPRFASNKRYRDLSVYRL